MGRIDNLKGDELAKDPRSIRALDTHSGMGFSSVSEGAFRVLSPEGLIVKGSARVDGELKGSGDLTWTGDVIVTGGGKIKVGSAMVLDPSVASGAIAFANGSQVFTDSTTIQVYLGNGVVQISNTEARLQLGGTVVSLTSAGVLINGLPAKTGTGLLPGLLWRDPASGQLYRITS